MNKTVIEYVTKRVMEVVKCHNGTIATKQNKSKKGTGLTDNAKIKQIRDGKATLRPDLDLHDIAKGYGNKNISYLFDFFTFETTAKQKEKIAFNERIDSAIEEMHQEVELAGKRLIDEAVLELIKIEDLPGRLEKLSGMFT